jgi:hypothetical protein
MRSNGTAANRQQRQSAFSLRSRGRTLAQRTGEKNQCGRGTVGGSSIESTARSAQGQV